MTEKFKINK